MEKFRKGQKIRRIASSETLIKGQVYHVHHYSEDNLYVSENLGVPYLDCYFEALEKCGTDRRLLCLK